MWQRNSSMLRCRARKERAIYGPALPGRVKIAALHMVRSAAAESVIGNHAGAPDLAPRALRPGFTIARAEARPSRARP